MSGLTRGVHYRATISQQQAFWLSRLNLHTTLYDATGQAIDLLACLHRTAAPTLDLPIALGRHHRLAARLVAIRVPQEVADQRRRRLRKEARDKGQRVTERTLALANWTVLVTNVPASQLSCTEAVVLLRARWQIELLFKLWKSHGQIDESRSAKPWRVLCEVYAKLLAMVVQHWIFLMSCWQYPDRSLRKAAHTVQYHALHLASTVDNLPAFHTALTVVQRCLTHGCRINKRRQAPSTYQRLLAPDLCP